MAATGKWFGLGLLGYQRGEITAWQTGATHKIALVTSGFTPDQDAHNFVDDIGANELAAGNGYAAGGIVLASKTVTYDTGTNEVRLDAADVTWNFTALKTFRYLVVYEDTGGAASTDDLIGWFDTGGDQAINGDFTFQFDATGVLKITAA